MKSVRESYDHLSCVILGVHVNDITPVLKNPMLLKAEKATLCERFEMTDLDEIHFPLGMSVKQNRESRTLTMS